MEINSPLTLVQPVFVVPGRDIDRPIPSLAGQSYLSVDRLPNQIKLLAQVGIRHIVLYGIPEKKSLDLRMLADANGLVQSAVTCIKREVPGTVVYADLCLCQYLSHGHCGVLRGNALDDEATCEALIPIARSYAECGIDGVMPSGMTEGIVSALKSQVCASAFPRLTIISQSPKFDSAFYAPFRKASSESGHLSIDKSSYQVSYKNLNEALREIELDLSEGADIIMVKPALGYLDVIHAAQERFGCSLAAFCTSGEYNLISAGASQGLFELSDVLSELVRSLQRAGARMLVTYFARDIAACHAVSKNE